MSDDPSVLLLNAHSKGGAATASRRILDGLCRLGMDATMYTMSTAAGNGRIVGPDHSVGKVAGKLRPRLDRLPLRTYGGATGAYSVGWVPDRLPRTIAQHDPDVVHLNWMGGGFMNATTPGRIDRPMVWRLPDMWPLTGGCHYPNGCDGFTDSCGTCPKIDSTRRYDLSWWTLRRKRRAWDGADITVVTPSTWLADQVDRSAVLGDAETRVIPNGLDTAVFKPADREIGRQRFNLPMDKHLVLFGAGNPFGNPRKGFDLLQEALVELSTGPLSDDLHLVVFGAETDAEAPDVGIETTCVGYLSDPESLSLLYSTAELMVVPSRYEGFGQTASEALACGTPVVAFDATGPRDTVDHRETGYLATPYEPESLAEGVRWVLADESRREELSVAARRKAERTFEIEGVARQYRALYQEVC